MNTFNENISPHVDRELQRAAEVESGGQPSAAFVHLERAHVLGQASTFQHVRVHLQMFAWGWRHGRARECVGQILRIVGASTKTVFGLVPSGNTGGSNISPFKSLPVEPELAMLIRNAQSRAK